MLGAIVLALIMVGSALAVLSSPLVSNSPSNPASPVKATAAVSSPSPSAASSLPAGKTLGINSALAASVKAGQERITVSGGNPAAIHPPNLHQAPPLSSTHGVVTPLYATSPAPMGVAYYGESNTTGTTQATTLNTSSLAGTWSTTDPDGIQANYLDGSNTGNPAGAYGAQLNAVLTNVTLQGQTAFATDNNAPTGCPSAGGYVALPGNVCPNEFWMQTYIEYTVSTHVLQVGDEIWNFSNPTANFEGTGTKTMEGFGTVQDSELYALSGSGYAFSVTIPYPFTLVLYINTTQGPCHVDSPTAKGGVPSCGTLSTTEPNNELFMNYTILNSGGARVCPTALSGNRPCGEYDDVFFNSVNPSTPTVGVPVHGANGQIDSAGIEATGSAYDPVGLTNDWEMDQGIASDDGATNTITYSDGAVAINYCTNANVSTSPGTFGQCQAYSSPPAAVDYGGETGETSIGEMSYWAPLTGAGPRPIAGGGVLGLGAPLAYLVTGPSLLLGLWNMTGNPYPYQLTHNAGGYPLSYQNIAPANAWIGVAQGAGVTSQFYFGLAPTFGWFSYWHGSGGSPTLTPLSYNLYLTPGMYTVEVLLSGYDPQTVTVNMLTSGAAPTIVLTPDSSTGAYTPEAAYSNADLANLSVSGSSLVGAGTTGSPYLPVGGSPNEPSQYGPAGSVSWLFSGLNDYLFQLYIGAYDNGTTAVAQFNPAPSFLINYPSWQLGALAEFDAPTTNGMQYYFLNGANLAVIGATDLYFWVGAETGQLYDIICNNCDNVLFASNTIKVSDEGVDLTTGGATLPVGNALQNTRNIFWGNTLERFPQTGYSDGFGGSAPFGIFAPGAVITDAQSFDRFYNNEFNAFSATENYTVSDTGSNLDWWNATCVSGYKPLAQETYPGSPNPGNGVCEPLSYSQSLDGFAMTGAINGASYQGGNAWYTYGNEPNPYANIPFVARTTTETGTAGISAAVTGAFKFRAGDYAPLITSSVSELTFKATGLPSSTTATAFEMTLANSTGYGWFNETNSSTTFYPASCGGGTYTCVNFYVPFGTLTYAASSVGLTPTRAANPATGSVVFNTPSQMVTIAFAQSYTVTFTETGLPASTRWYVNVSGQTSVTGTTTTLTKSLPNGSYTFTAATVDKLYAPSYTPSFTVAGAPVGVPVTFSVFTYSATFTETGLPGGNWNVTANAVNMAAAAGGPIVYHYSNGTFVSYTVGVFQGFTASPSHGNFTINGGPFSQLITFSRVTYSVSFTESGLPVGDEW
ncbi:MAG: thermopsin family protease, partial [Thermoplasmata archaeon]